MGNNSIIMIRDKIEKDYFQFFICCKNISQYQLIPDYNSNVNLFVIIVIPSNFYFKRDENPLL